MTRIFISSTLLAVSAFAAAPAAAQVVTPCDYAAGHPDDPARVVPGLERPEIDTPAAEAICKEVLEAMPDHARTNYLTGRVIFYQGRTAEALPFLEKSAEAGHAQALFVLGYVDAEGFRPDPDICRGLTYLRRAAALDHPWSGYHLVLNTLNGKFAECEGAPGKEELPRFMALAADNVTVSASAGRVEKLSGELDAHLAQ